jgi:hypothetical protein
VALFFAASAEEGDTRGIVDTAGSLLDILRELGKLSGELRHVTGIVNLNTQINVTASPQFLRLSDGLLRIARAHPQAKPDIVALLRGLDEPESHAGGLPANRGHGNRTALSGPLMRPDAPVIECEAVDVG